ncbi:MAG: DUF4434 domain-containing protein [Kiritimatiellae bacterium]|nr:DUF4434 domain-containing protein [Kiritimatiellia bacterium]
MSSATKTNHPYPDISLTLIPPTPVTDQIILDIRGAIRNATDSAKRYQAAIYFDAETPASLLHSARMEIGPHSAAGIACKVPTQGHAGIHGIVMVVRSDADTWRQQQQIEILASKERSTRRLGGAWVDLLHHSIEEGKPYNSELRQMTDSQWRELIQAMHAVEQNIVVITATVLPNRAPNDVFPDKHKFETDGYHGNSLYPSRLHPDRVPLGSDDPLETIFDEADRLGMHVMPGVGWYELFNYSPASLEWHKRVADELWQRYGHHASFYGWYVSEEAKAGLGSAREREDMVEFFREFTPYCHCLAPDKPVMLAPGLWPSRDLRGAEDAYRKVLPHVDILCPFAFYRIWRPGMTGEEASDMLESLCKETGCHFWMDEETFDVWKTADDKIGLVPRGIDGIKNDFERFTNFEKILHYSFAGMMCSPTMSRKPGGEPAVQLYLDYQRYLERLRAAAGPIK